MTAQLCGGGEAKLIRACKRSEFLTTSLGGDHHSRCIRHLTIACFTTGTCRRHLPDQVLLPHGSKYKHRAQQTITRWD
jgi:hypothetical protein